MVEDTGILIINILVLFKSISGAQEQNQKPLMRELSSKESDEKEYKEAMKREQSAATRKAHEVMEELAAQFERQKKSSDNTIHAYVGERDAMLASTEKAVSISTGVNNDAVATVKGQSDLAKEPAEAHKHMQNGDDYRFRPFEGGYRRIAKGGWTSRNGTRSILTMMRRTLN